MWWVLVLDHSVNKKGGLSICLCALDKSFFAFCDIHSQKVPIREDNETNARGKDSLTCIRYVGMPGIGNGIAICSACTGCSPLSGLLKPRFCLLLDVLEVGTQPCVSIERMVSLIWEHSFRQIQQLCI